MAERANQREAEIQIKHNRQVYYTIPKDKSIKKEKV